MLPFAPHPPLLFVQGVNLLLMICFADWKDLTSQSVQMKKNVAAEVKVTCTTTGARHGNAIMASGLANVVITAAVCEYDRALRTFCTASIFACSKRIVLSG